MYKLDSGQRTAALYYFLLFNLILSIIIAYPYLSYGPTIGDFWSWVYTRLAFVSTLTLFIVALGFILYPLTRFISSPLQLLLLHTTVLFLFQIFLLSDVKLYGIFRFHINGFIINTITTEGAGDSVQLGGKTIATMTFVLTTLLLLEVICQWGLVRYFSHQRRFPSFMETKKLILILFLLMTIIADKGIFAYANFYDMTDITRYQKLFPLYLPLFADETITKYFHLKKDNELISYNARSSMLNYPLQKFRAEENLKPVNMVWIVIESWRFDMMSEETTPGIHRFSQDALVFENHYSGGNASRFGIYSLFYGLYGTYWHQFLAERRSPVFLDILQKMNYDFKIISSTRLTYPEFLKTTFVKLPSSTIDDHLPGKSGAERDPHAAKRFEDFLNHRDINKPFFSFTFLDAPHAPYRYPIKFAKFQPAAEEINYFTIKKAYAQAEVQPVFNRYRNAIFFADSVVNTMIEALRKKGLLESTVVIITGDHGEEFYENGYFSHNSAFSEYQIKVPFILYIPGEKPGRVTRLTSHADVVPTMLSLMGSQITPSLYSHGRPLLAETEDPYVVASGWDTFAFIDPSVTIVLSTETYNARSAEVRTGRYQLAEDPKLLLSARTGQLLTVTKNLSNFLK